MYARIVAERLPVIQESLILAARRSGREPDAVRLVGVTKGHPPAAVDALLKHGVHDIGENRVEELEQKFPIFDGREVRWHMIGHVQSRKAPRAARWADLIHSVDSVRLAHRLGPYGVEAACPVEVLIQVNTTGEATKSGFSTTEAMDRIAEISEIAGLSAVGLMTMAPHTDDESVLRRAFRSLRTLQEQAATCQGFTARELSMGMSNDFCIAVEEGSTMVRLGTALLGERQA